MQPAKEFKHRLTNIFKILVQGLVIKEGKRRIIKSIKETITIIQLSDDGD